MDCGLDLGWTQTITIISTILPITVISTATFYYITSKRIDRLEEFHREDIKLMDSKWERLFERLLLKDRKVK